MRAEVTTKKGKPQPTRKPIGVTAKVGITSLNSHFWPRHPYPNLW